MLQGALELVYFVDCIEKAWQEDMDWGYQSLPGFERISENYFIASGAPLNYATTEYRRSGKDNCHCAVPTLNNRR